MQRSFFVCSVLCTPYCVFLVCFLFYPFILPKPRALLGLVTKPGVSVQSCLAFYACSYKYSYSYASSYVVYGSLSPSITWLNSRASSLAEIDGPLSVSGEDVSHLQMVSPKARTVAPAAPKQHANHILEFVCDASLRSHAQRPFHTAS